MSADDSAGSPAAACPDCASTKLKPTGMQVMIDRDAGGRIDPRKMPRTITRHYECGNCGRKFSVRTVADV